MTFLVPQEGELCALCEEKIMDRISVNPVQMNQKKEESLTL